MPPIIPPASQWLADQLASAKIEIAALRNQRTTYITDTEERAQAIIGNLAADPSGNATGLTGWGIAVLAAGQWRRVGGYASGKANLVWPGGSTLSNELVVPHSLGAVPQVVLATVNTSGQGQVVACHATATSTQVKIQAAWTLDFQPGAGAEIPVSWRAEL